MNNRAGVTPILYNNKIKEKNKENVYAHAQEQPQIEVKKSSFTKPTFEQVQDYFDSRNCREYAERFYDYYTSNGWHVGKQPMKDWQAACRNWQRNEDNYNNRHNNNNKTKKNYGNNNPDVATSIADLRAFAYRLED